MAIVLRSDESKKVSRTGLAKIDVSFECTIHVELQGSARRLFSDSNGSIAARSSGLGRFST